MIGYITLGTNDLERGARFYDALLSELGAKRDSEVKGYFVSWAVGPGVPSIALGNPFDGNPATVGNGSMVGLTMKNPAQVDSFHKKALELGAKDEGAPGPRDGGSFYAAYFRDLDGNKLACYCMSK